MRQVTLLAIVLWALGAAAQDPVSSRTEHIAAVVEPPAISLSFDSMTKVPFIDGSVGIESPIRCGGDGMIFLRLGGDFNNVIGIASNGYTTKYSITNINDIPNAFLVKYFPADNAVYALVRGTVQTSRSTRVRGGTGGNTFDRTLQVRDVAYYIARFDLDGSYRGSAKLELPFRPVQIGAFPSGDFVVSGNDEISGEPKIAMVRSNGQLDRYIEMTGDINATSSAVKSLAKSNNSGFVPGALAQLVATSELIADRGKLLLVRRQSEVTVFEISPTGEVRRVGIKRVSDGATLDSLKPANGRWLLQMTKPRKDGLGVTIFNYFVDPQDGHLMGKLVFDTPVGLGLACIRDGEVSALRLDKGSLVVLRAPLGQDTIITPAK